MHLLTAFSNKVKGYAIAFLGLIQWWLGIGWSYHYTVGYCQVWVDANGNTRTWKARIPRGHARNKYYARDRRGFYLYISYSGDIWLSVIPPSDDQLHQCSIPDTMQIFRISLRGLHVFEDTQWRKIKWDRPTDEPVPSKVSDLKNYHLYNGNGAIVGNASIRKTDTGYYYKWQIGKFGSGPSAEGELGTLVQALEILDSHGFDLGYDLVAARNNSERTGLS